MKLGKIDHVILFGGSRMMAELAVFIQQKTNFRLDLYSCDRQLEEQIYADDSRTLADLFQENDLQVISSDDINQETTLLPKITETTLGVGLGEAWSFSKTIIEVFQGRLLDFMGIRLPQYKGGAHYTWQILRGNKLGACNLQVINEDMIQGEVCTGEIVKFKEYFFPANARIPEDYFKAAVEEEISFLIDFFEELSTGVGQFNAFSLQENFTLFFPRLYTKEHAYINWDWTTLEIEKFICAFDEPYPGAMTFINGEKVILKDVYSESNDGDFHPFQVGLVYKIYNQSLFVATKNGTLVIKRVLNENGDSVVQKIKEGDRLFTPRDFIEKAMQKSVSYSSKGLN